MVETTEFFPSHFMVRIESFSLLLENGIDKYESSEFEAGGYKWRLIIYPNGKDCGPEGDYVAVYLSVADPSSLVMSWEVNIVFGIFLHNQLSDNFLCMRGKARCRFHAMSPSWGFSKFISKMKLMDPSNGYLVNDICVFGADVFGLKRPDIIERFSLRKATEPYIRSFTIPNFSKIKNYWRSDNFRVGDLSWFARLYPQGCDNAKGRYVSIFLYEADGNQKVKADFTARMKDQTSDYHVSCTDSFWFDVYGWGWYDFMPIADMNDPAEGFVVNNCCILEVEITVLAVARTSP